MRTRSGRSRTLRLTGATLIVCIIAIAALFHLGLSRFRSATPAPTASLTVAQHHRGARASSGDDRIKIAQEQATITPSYPAGYIALAAAYVQRARETGDSSLNQRAQVALDRARDLAPDHPDLQKLDVVLLLTNHRFVEALDAARRLQALRPEDAEVYGFLTDAHVELGNYDDAVRAAQQMVDLRPEPAAYARVSYLRSLYGDIPGAIEAMRLAVQTASGANREALAWYRVHLGLELIVAGNVGAAERELDRALATLPDYPLALAAKARARVAAGDLRGAVTLYQRAQNRVPLPDTVIALGNLYANLGRTEEAQRQYDLLEFIERSAQSGTETYSRQLALFWADNDRRLDEALAIVQRERTTKNDIFTNDVLAWCLLKKGELAAAKAAADRALRLGTRDARIHYHAGMIARALGDEGGARHHLQLALEIDPSFDLRQSDIAKQALAELERRDHLRSESPARPPAHLGG